MVYDIIFAGGGLAASLTAWRLSIDQPQLKVLIVEQGATLGGNHTWSFFKTDLEPAEFDWIAPLILYRWNQYEVHFPKLRRQFQSTYCTTTSDTLHQQLTALLPEDAIRTGASIADLTAEGLTLEDGEMLQARCVIDCRGPAPDPHLILGFQKFTGQILELEDPHDLKVPIIMDATVPQADDYRFFYTLPLTPTRVLVEDTRYSNTPHLDHQADQEAIAQYVAHRGWRQAQCVRSEQGALPITLGGDIEAFWQAKSQIPCLGLRAALFHTTTGYSLPDAVRMAKQLSQHPSLLTSSARAYHFIRDYSIRHWREQSFLRLLNRMLFIAAQPEKRHLVLAHFYRRPQALVERFHAGRLYFFDKVRILTGYPPVPILKAMRCLPESSAVRAKTRENTREKHA